MINRVYTSEDLMLDVYCISSQTNGYLLVKNNCSLLIDCPGGLDVIKILSENALPLPSAIIHTQVQQEHCAEWEQLPYTPVYVYEKAKEIALVSKEYQTDSKTVWDNGYDWDERGQEKYGIAGCIIERPPLKPLNIAGTVSADKSFVWESTQFILLPFEASGKYSVGFYIKEYQMIFSGDLICGEGYLVNLYDLERSYAEKTGYHKTLNALEMLEKLPVKILFPTTGEAIKDTRSSIGKLKASINSFLNDKMLFKTDYSHLKIAKQEKCRSLMQLKEVADGIFQCNDFGNFIIFIDKNGDAVAVDPDHSKWSTYEMDLEIFIELIDGLEKHYGLKRVTNVLITHYHGDHVRFSDYLRERYSAKIMTSSEVAKILENPDDYNYPCLLPWYNQSIKTVEIDEVIEYGEKYILNNISVTAFHSTGHCFAHASFLVEFEGKRAVATGDALLYDCGWIAVDLPVIYNDVAWHIRGCKPTFEKIKQLKPDFVLCGHGMFFSYDDEVLDKFIKSTDSTYELIKQMLGSADVEEAMTPDKLNIMRNKLYEFSE
jgi:glyoxylase-like metal-dependent hydrolase (beta-lactamase superfamily II)